jgi:hypothetical protein
MPDSEILRKRYNSYLRANAELFLTVGAIGFDMSIKGIERLTGYSSYKIMSDYTDPVLVQALGLGLETLVLLGFPILNMIEKRKEKALGLNQK